MTDLQDAEAVMAELREQMARAGGMLAWCKRAGITHAAVSLVMSGTRPMSEGIANRAGYQQVTKFRKIARGAA